MSENLKESYCLQIKPFLKAYLVSKFGAQIDVKRDSLFSNAISLYSLFAFECQIKVIGESKMLQKLDVIILKLGSHNYKKIIDNPSVDSYLNKLIYTLFCQELISFIRARRKSKIKIKEAIFEFYDLYDIDEDLLSLKAAEKIWSRRSKR